VKENELLAHSRRKVETFVSNESKEDDVVSNGKQEKGGNPPVDDEEAEADF
jgi:hypothetical protein